MHTDMTYASNALTMPRQYICEGRKDRKEEVLDFGALYCYERGHTTQ